MYCQKCRTPLKLDGSLEDLNPAAYDLLVAASAQQHTNQKPTSSARHSYANDRSRQAAYEHAQRNSGPATFKRHSGGGGGGGGGGDKGLRDSSMSFILLGDSQVGPPRRSSHSKGVGGTSSRGSDSSAPARTRSLHYEDDDASQSHEMRRMTKLFEILSARSDVDHPVCVECTEILVDGLQKRLESAARERDTYVAFLKKLEVEAPTDDEVRAQEEDLEKAKRQEAEALRELLALEREKEELDGEILSLEEEARKMDAEEEQFWRERNEFASRLAEFQSERDSINSKFDHDSRLLQNLQRSNVYNDTFCISHDGTFATINGLRLGRLSNNPVDWPEINAAWGHALLLIVTVADKLAYRFDGYEPQPMGSTSRIIRYELPSPSSSRLGAGLIVGSGAGTGGSLRQRLQQQQQSSHPPAPLKKHVLELFSSGDMPLGLTFMHRKFDNAMVAFLELVRQLGALVERQTAASDRPLSLPYRIEGDRISDISIKLGIAQDDGWTKACKLTLTCCKFLLAHASNINSISNGRGSVR